MNPLITALIGSAFYLLVIPAIGVGCAWYFHHMDRRDIADCREDRRDEAKPRRRQNPWFVEPR